MRLGAAEFFCWLMLTYDWAIAEILAHRIGRLAAVDGISLWL
jgi:hypothetical protein